MRVLVIQLKRLGDLVLTTPVFSALRKCSAPVQISLAAATASKGLVPLLDVDETFHFGKGRNDWFPFFKSSFDVCLDLVGNDRSALLTALSRAPRRITYSRFASKPLRKTIYTDFVQSDVTRLHTADHHLDLLQPLGIHVSNEPSHLRLPHSHLHSPSAQYAVLHVGTARSEKYWVAERWAQVADWLTTQKGLPVYLTGGKDSCETEHLKQLLRTCKSTPIDLSGKISLPELANWIAGARILASVDSVPIHLADAVRTPVVGLFGPTDPKHWQPRFTQTEIVRASQMADISSESVIKAMNQILLRPSA